MPLLLTRDGSHGGEPKYQKYSGRSTTCKRRTVLKIWRTGTICNARDCRGVAPSNALHRASDAERHYTSSESQTFSPESGRLTWAPRRLPCGLIPSGGAVASRRVAARETPGYVRKLWSERAPGRRPTVTRRQRSREREAGCQYVAAYQEANHARDLDSQAQRRACHPSANRTVSRNPSQFPSAGCDAHTGIHAPAKPPPAGVNKRLFFTHFSRTRRASLWHSRRQLLGAATNPLPPDADAGACGVHPRHQVEARVLHFIRVLHQPELLRLVRGQRMELQEELISRPLIWCWRRCRTDRAWLGARDVSHPGPGGDLLPCPPPPALHAGLAFAERPQTAEWDKERINSCTESEREAAPDRETRRETLVIIGAITVGVYLRRSSGGRLNGAALGVVSGDTIRDKASTSIFSWTQSRTRSP
ncbi:Hypothetical predicted protein [Olea europaea subsp. europaea]|uniref:Uncharacterized protein n=1 Tax=Olea europaea subsp. europaea TaxID=158383 RepID=A0A8S0UMF5_OLEEU|nr:Hypothetical predicted protein [Olea europaea subsp. europaea]